MNKNSDIRKNIKGRIEHKKNLYIEKIETIEELEEKIFNLKKLHQGLYKPTKKYFEGFCRDIVDSGSIEQSVSTAETLVNPDTFQMMGLLEIILSKLLNYKREVEGPPQDNSSTLREKSRERRKKHSKGRRVRKREDGGNVAFMTEVDTSRNPSRDKKMRSFHVKSSFEDAIKNNGSNVDPSIKETRNLSTALMTLDSSKY